VAHPARNPWVADVRTDPVVHARMLRRLHERDVAGDGRPASRRVARLQWAVPATSDAPELVEARRLRGESLRCSMLTTADPEILIRWLSHPAGADDLAAARTLVALLPCGDTRSAAATATALALARRTSRATISDQLQPDCNPFALAWREPIPHRRRD
jgi:hypothetical protein